MEQPVSLDPKFLGYAIDNLRVKPNENGVDASGMLKKKKNTSALV
jgi:hypothetical protein